MADSPAFVVVCEALEANSVFNRLEARGTVRLALRESGLEAARADVRELKMVLQKVLPGELELRNIPNSAALCDQIAAELDAAGLPERSVDSPEDVFARLGG
jgi:hypothetical protein